MSCVTHVQDNLSSIVVDLRQTQAGELCQLLKSIESYADAETKAASAATSLHYAFVASVLVLKAS